jgi:ubiquinone/menaquinone biosynthesis C-methylase UbiE
VDDGIYVGSQFGGLQNPYLIGKHHLLPVLDNPEQVLKSLEDLIALSTQADSGSNRVITGAALTQRQIRELKFYQQFSERNASSEVCFDSILGKETRPWNSYWRVAELARTHFKSESQTLLDFGCGAGESSVLFSRIGYEVFGFDLSPNNISIAGRLARKYGVEGRTHFSVSVAEKLDYPTESFDVVVGTDILHHVDIARALAETLRVLKKGGLAIFHEPIRAPVFDVLRETSFGTWLFPKQASIDHHITEDERKLNKSDLEIIKSFDANFSAQRFLLFARLDRFIRKSNSTGPSFLEQLDFKLFRLFPFLKKYGGIAVIVLRK